MTQLVDDVTWSFLGLASQSCTAGYPYTYREEQLKRKKLISRLVEEERFCVSYNFIPLFFFALYYTSKDLVNKITIQSRHSVSASETAVRNESRLCIMQRRGNKQQEARVRVRELATDILR